MGLLLFRGVLFFLEDLSLGDELGDPLADEGGLLVPEPDSLLGGRLDADKLDHVLSQ